MVKLRDTASHSYRKGTVFPGPKVIKHFSCSKLSMKLSIKFILLINVKMPTIVDLNLKFPLILVISIFMSSFNSMLNSVEHENFFITSRPEMEFEPPYSGFPIRSVTNRAI